MTAPRSSTTSRATTDGTDSMGDQVLKVWPTVMPSQKPASFTWECPRP